ncbi:hypothetical protein COCNU_scaffold004112G000030 [Cocos nucifera]|nr:hypothetical protein [Cocos nucifera]
MLSYSKLFHKDLLKKLYSRGPITRGLIFSRKELAGASPPRKKKKEEKKRERIILSSFSKVDATKADVAEVDVAGAKRSNHQRKELAGASPPRKKKKEEKKRERIILSSFSKVDATKADVAEVDVAGAKVTMATD